MDRSFRFSNSNFYYYFLLFFFFKNNLFIGIGQFFISNILITRLIVRFTFSGNSCDMICTFIIWFFFRLIFLRPGNILAFLLFLEIRRTLRSNVTKTLTTMTLNSSLDGLFFGSSLSLKITVFAYVKRDVLDIRSTSTIHYF